MCWINSMNTGANYCHILCGGAPALPPPAAFDFRRLGESWLSSHSAYRVAWQRTASKWANVSPVLLITWRSVTCHVQLVAAPDCLNIEHSRVRMTAPVRVNWRRLEEELSFGVRCYWFFRRSDRKNKDACGHVCHLIHLVRDSSSVIFN